MGPRRSARRAATRKSYEDAFEGLDLGDDLGEGSSTRLASSQPKRRRADDSDEEFNDIAVQKSEQFSEAEDTEEAIDSVSEQDADGPYSNSDDDSEIGDEGAKRRSKLKHVVQSIGKFGTSGLKQRKGHTGFLFNSSDTHTRGVYNPTEHVGKSMHIKLSFGMDNRDLLAAAAARDQWSLGVDATFPTRESLEKPPSINEYGPGATHGVEGGLSEREATKAWDWYYDDEHGSLFRKKQRIFKIDKQTAEQKYLYKSSRPSHQIIYGPSDNLSKIHLGQYEALDFGISWKYRDETHKPGRPVNVVKQRGRGRGRKPAEATSYRHVNASTHSEYSTTSKDHRRKNRYGWLLNLAGKVQSLEWAPNQEGRTQFLIASVPISKGQEKQYESTEPPVASRAFSVSPPFPGALQIWSFNAEERKNGLIQTIDTAEKPRLRQVMCMDFGHIRKLSWCHMPRKRRKREEHRGTYDLGLLACVFSDGRTRIIDVELDMEAGSTEYLYVASAAFTAMPAPTISTCMAWLSPSDVVIGCANGWVAVYNIQSHQTSSKPDGNEDEPVPYIYIPVHTTYITNIETAYPQHPHIISTVSMDGNTRLISLLDPAKDVVDTQRQRLGTTHISYYPHLQAFASSDENDFIRGLSIRRFYTVSAVGKVPSTITAIARGSRWHPSVMVGCTEGSVWCFNPLRRFMHSKESYSHGRWFMHEWAAGKDEHSPNTSRFTDELQVESPSLVRDVKNGTRIANGVMTITIYDEEQHVVTVSWNPNQRYSGWAAAGMGSGLIRVEDLAIFH